MERELTQRVDQVLRGGTVAEQRERAKQALALLEGIEPQSDTLKGLHAYARMTLADDPDTKDAFGLEAFELLGATDWQAQVMVQLGLVAAERSHIGQAIARFERAAEIARPQADLLRLGTALTNIATAKRMQGDVEAAVDSALEARSAFARLGDVEREAQALTGLGSSYRILGALPEALACFTTSLELLEQSGAEAASAPALAQIAKLYGLAGVPEAAIRYANRATEVAPPQSHGSVAAWHALSEAREYAGDIEGSIEAAERALAEARHEDLDILVGGALMRVADSLCLAGRYAEAEPLYVEGQEIAERSGEVQMQFLAAFGRALVEEQRGDYAAAEAFLRSTLEASEREGERHSLIELHEFLSRLVDAQDRPDEALSHLKRAYEIRNDVFSRETDLRLRSIQAAQDLKREQARSADALRKLSRRVMESQEQERRRVAQDLHDDIGQSLALHAVEIDLLAQEPPGSSDAVSKELDRLADSARDVAGRVQAISRQLHSAPLNQLGLVGAVSWMCDEVSRVHGIEIECEARDVPPGVHPDRALCLYRIVQEGLNNAVRHGNASRAIVALATVADGVRVQVSDDGRGFDPGRLESPGIGLASMRERALHLGGSFSIWSRPGEGTRVEAALPLDETTPPS